MAQQKMISHAEIDQSLHFAKLDNIISRNKKKNGKLRNITIEDGSERLKTNASDII